MQNGMRVNMGSSASSLTAEDSIAKLPRHHGGHGGHEAHNYSKQDLASVSPVSSVVASSILQRDLRAVRRNRALRERQRRSERHHRLHPFAAARHVEPHEQMRFRVHTNADAVVLSQLVHRQRIDGRRDGSGVVEDRSVERASDTPPVLRVYQEQIAIAEAVVEIPAQTMRSAKRW